VGELDTRGSHFYLALYWAEALAAQTEDKALQHRFAKVAKQLAENEQTIVAELNAAQGMPVDIGGYYRPNAERTSQAMRPSPTLNAIVDVSGDSSGLASSVEDDGPVQVGAPADDEAWEVQDDGTRGRAQFVVASGRSYNRVEGLPIKFGPAVAGRHPRGARTPAMGRDRGARSSVLSHREVLGHRLDRRHRDDGSRQPPRAPSRL
jgi:hypothetical protein